MQIFIFTSVVIGFTMMSCSRELPERSVPSLVKNAFRSQFVDARDIDWEKSNHHYLVEFESGAAEGNHRALFDTLGTMVMYKHDMAVSNLPSTIVDFIKSQYQGYKIDDIENLKREGITYYQVELEKGMRDRHLVFSTDGVLQNNIAYWD